MEYIELTINGLKCECVDRTSDSFERTVVEHRIIGYNGPFLEDGGINSRTLNLDTLWHGENYAGHETFLAVYSKSNGIDTITHPIYGNIRGKIRSVSVIHNSTEKRAAHINIDFLEDGLPNVAKNARFLFGTAAANTSPVVAEMAKKAANAVNAMGGFINKINDVRAMMAQVRSRAAQITKRFNAAIDAITYPSTLAGEMLDVAVGAVDAANTGIDKLIHSPSAAAFGVRQNVFALKNKVERLNDIGGDILADLILSYSLFNECLLIASANDEYEAQGGAGDYAQSAQTAAGLAAAVKAMVKFANEQFEDNRQDRAELARTVNLVAQGVDATLASTNRETLITIEGETSIYRILLERQIPLELAVVVCQRNWIENPNRVTGQIYVPII